MSSNITYAYAASITKAEKTADGHLMVHGKAAGPELDLDGQICDPVWLKAAMPDWHRWGNIRAQHGPVAAGVGKELVEDGHSWMLTAKVVDADAKTKVEEGVYKGFSIGVKNARVIRDNQAPKGRIVAGDIVEISLVDRPANPYATLAICKSAGAGLGPVNSEGMMLPLMPDTRKVALVTVNGVLDGDLLKELAESDDVEGAWSAIRQIADLIISEAEGLKSGKAHEIRDIEELLRAVRCLECFIDREDGEPDDYPDMGADVAAYKALLLDEEASLKAEITKAVLAEVRKGLPPALTRDDDDEDGFEDDDEDEEDEEGDQEQYKAHVTKALESDLVKRFFSEKTRDRLAREDKAMPGGRYPIESREDVENAIALSGMGKGSKAAIQRHIMRRARAVGAADLIPAGWGAGAAVSKAVASDDMVGQLLTKVATLEESLRTATETAQGSAAEVEAMRAELKKFAGTPVPGGPRLVAPSVSVFSPEPASDAQRYRQMSQAPDLAPDVRAGLRELAAREEGLTVS